jgi:hypothetical protein
MPSMDKFGTGTNLICAILSVEKYLWFRFLTDPIFFCQLYYFFKAIGRATLFSPGGCGLLPKWQLLSHICCQKKNYFRPTDPNFFVI